MWLILRPRLIIYNIPDMCFSRSIFLFICWCAVLSCGAQSNYLDSLQSFSQLVTGSGDGKISFEQSLSWDAERPYLLTLTRQETDKRGNAATRRYEFDLSEVDSDLLRTQESQGVIRVRLSTKAGLLAQISEEGEIVSYDSEVELLASDVGEAEYLEAALRVLISGAGKLANADRSKPVELLARHRAISKQLTSGAQRWEPGCLVRYATVLERGKKNVEALYSFDLADIDPSEIRIESKETTLLLNLVTKNARRFIALSEDGELPTYTNELFLPVTDLMAARDLRRQLRAAVEACPSEVSAVSMKQVQQLIASTGMIEGAVSSSLRAADESGCRWKFVIKEDTNRKVRESVYEFTLEDLGADKLDLEVRSSGVQLVLPTQYNEKVIKRMYDGTKEEFLTEFSIPVDKVATGKILMASFQKAILECGF